MQNQLQSSQKNETTKMTIEQNKQKTHIKKNIQKELVKQVLQKSQVIQEHKDNELFLKRLETQIIKKIYKIGDIKYYLSPYDACCVICDQNIDEDQLVGFCSSENYHCICQQCNYTIENDPDDDDEDQLKYIKCPVPGCNKAFEDYKCHKCQVKQMYITLQNNLQEYDLSQYRFMQPPGKETYLCLECYDQIDNVFKLSCDISHLIPQNYGLYQLYKFNQESDGEDEEGDDYLYKKYSHDELQQFFINNGFIICKRCNSLQYIYCECNKQNKNPTKYKNQFYKEHLKCSFCRQKIFSEFQGFLHQYLCEKQICTYCGLNNSDHLQFDDCPLTQQFRFLYRAQILKTEDMDKFIIQYIENDLNLHEDLDFFSLMQHMTPYLIYNDSFNKITLEFHHQHIIQNKQFNIKELLMVKGQCKESLTDFQIQFINGNNVIYSVFIKTGDILQLDESTDVFMILRNEKIISQIPYVKQMIKINSEFFTIVKNHMSKYNVQKYMVNEEIIQEEQKQIQYDTQYLESISFQLQWKNVHIINNKDTCPICLCEQQQPAILCKNNHQFCNACINAQSFQQNKCPNCRQDNIQCKQCKSNGIFFDGKCQQCFKSNQQMTQDIVGKNNIQFDEIYLKQQEKFDNIQQFSDKFFNEQQLIMCEKCTRPQQLCMCQTHIDLDQYHEFEHKCVFCSIIYTDIYNLLLHYIICEKNNKIKCLFCGQYQHKQQCHLMRYSEFIHQLLKMDCIIQRIFTEYLYNILVLQPQPMQFQLLQDNQFRIFYQGRFNIDQKMYNKQMEIIIDSQIQIFSDTKVADVYLDSDIHIIEFITNQKQLIVKNKKNDKITFKQYNCDKYLFKVTTDDQSNVIIKLL